jgi:uncharacterized protein YggE
MDTDVSTPSPEPPGQPAQPVQLAQTRQPAPNTPTGSRRRPLLVGAGAAGVALALLGSYLLGGQRADAATASGSASLVAVGAGSGVGQVADVARAGTTSPGVGGITGGITVTGTGIASGTPDTLLLSMSVSVTAGSVTDALSRANARAAAVQKSLRASGVAERDLQTTGLSINPHYDNKGSAITGYDVSESVTAKLRPLDKAGAAIGAAVTAGGDAARVDGISLDLGDTSTLVAGARNSAFVAAKQKAEQYAKAAGVRLGGLVALTDVVSTPSPIGYPMAAQASADAGSVPIAAGSQDLTVTVTVTFAIG